MVDESGLPNRMVGAWVAEFGEDYDVPAIVLEALGRFDISWHNDVCPRFGVVSGDRTLSLWVDHVDPDRREYGADASRYLVEVGDDIVFEGDDVEAALAAYLAAR